MVSTYAKIPNLQIKSTLRKTLNQRIEKLSLLLVFFLRFTMNSKYSH